MRNYKFNRFSSLLTHASQFFCWGVVLLGISSLGLLGCSRQPELISPAAKAEPKSSDSPDAATAEQASAASLEAENALAEASPAPNALGDSSVKSDSEVQVVALKPAVTDNQVKPATHVVEIGLPVVAGRSTLDGPAKIAKVLLSDAEQKICKLKVGDTIPSITLPSLTGQATQLNALTGKKLTVITFWNPQDPYSTWELSDLSGDVLKPYESMGVKVVSICSGTADAPVDAATAQASVDQAKAMFPCLLDADGSTLAKFGTDRTSRTYLIDAEGKILWFDIEYSRSTRRELKSALSFLLEKQVPVKAVKIPAKK